MNAFLLLCLIFAPAVLSAGLYDSFAGASDQAKIDNLRIAVARFHQYTAGQVCFVRTYSGAFFTPGDAGTINRWVAWLCAYFGGPEGSENCTWYSQFGDNDTRANTTEELASALQLKHVGFEISDAQNNLFVHLLAAAMAIGGPAGLADDIEAELLANVTVVDVDHAGDPCDVADVVIDWHNPVGPVITSVAVNGIISWNWTDALEHSVAPNTGETVTFLGFGGGPRMLTSAQGCLDDNGGFPDGGTPCNLGGNGVFAYSKIFGADDTIGYHCENHGPTQMRGTLTVGAGDTNTGTGTGTVADGGDGSSFNTNPNEGSPASKISSWMF